MSGQGDYYKQQEPQQQPPQQQYYQQPPLQQPGYHPEIDSIKSMLSIAGILALIFGILTILGGLWYVYLFIMWTALLGEWGLGFIPIFSSGYLIWMIVLFVFAVFDFMIFSATKRMSSMVDAGQYTQAKSNCLTWTVLGFVLGGALPGILLLIAYMKFDPLIRATQQGPYPPQQQQPYYQQPPPQQQFYQQPQQQQPPQDQQPPSQQ